MFRRKARPATPPPITPSPDWAQAQAVNRLEFSPSLIKVLAIKYHYDFESPEPKTLLKLALYSFLCNADSARKRLFYSGDCEADEAELILADEDWTLSTFLSLTNSRTTTNGMKLGGEYSSFRRGKVCGHVFQPGESVYRCRDCSLDPTCVLCSHCYKGSNHEKDSHDITTTVHAGMGAGCCDCGDREAYKEGKEGSCRYHSNLPEGVSMEGETIDEGKEAEIEKLKTEVEALVRTVMDWMIQVLEDSPEEVKAPRSTMDIALPTPPPVVNARLTPLSSTSTSASASTSFTDFRSTISTASMIIPPFDPTSAFNFASSSSSSMPSSSIPLNAAPPLPPPPSNSPGPYSIILWNDEKHSFLQVISQLVRSISCSRSVASTHAQRVDTHGRSTVFTSSNLDQILWVTKMLAGIDLSCSTRRAEDVWNEEVAGLGIGWLRDLCACEIGGEGGVLMEVVAKVMLERGEGGNGNELSRFQRLVGVDARLWKEARKGLVEIYVMLLGVSAEVKKEISE